MWALVLCEGGEIGTEHLPVEKMRLARLVPVATAEPPAGAPPAADRGALPPRADSERQQILDVLAEAGSFHNQTRAAKIPRLSDLTRHTHHARLKRYGVKEATSQR